MSRHHRNTSGTPSRKTLISTAHALKGLGGKGEQQDVDGWWWVARTRAKSRVKVTWPRLAG